MLKERYWNFSSNVKTLISVYFIFSLVLLIRWTREQISNYTKKDLPSFLRPFKKEFQRFYDEMKKRKHWRGLRRSYSCPSDAWKAQLCKREGRGTRRTRNERTLNVGEITNHVVAHSKRRTFDRIEPPRCQPRSCSLPLRRVHRFSARKLVQQARTVIEIREFHSQIPSYDWHVLRAKKEVYTKWLKGRETVDLLALPLARTISEKSNGSSWSVRGSETS